MPHALSACAVRAVFSVMLLKSTARDITLLLSIDLRSSLPVFLTLARIEAIVGGQRTRAVDL